MISLERITKFRSMKISSEGKGGCESLHQQKFLAIIWYDVIQYLDIHAVSRAELGT